MALKSVKIQIVFLVKKNKNNNVFSFMPTQPVFIKSITYVRHLFPNLEKKLIVVTVKSGSKDWKKLSYNHVFFFRFRFWMLTGISKLWSSFFN